MKYSKQIEQFTEYYTMLIALGQIKGTLSKDTTLSLDTIRKVSNSIKFKIDNSLTIEDFYEILINLERYTHIPHLNLNLGDIIAIHKATTRKL